MSELEDNSIEERIDTLRERVKSDLRDLALVDGPEETLSFVLSIGEQMQRELAEA